MEIKLGITLVSTLQNNMIHNKMKIFSNQPGLQLYTGHKLNFKFPKWFKSKFNFTEIDCKKEKIKWPKKSGVYVIWKNDDSSLDNLIYVGMTGKFNRVNKEKVIFNSQTFDKRDERYTPYRFCESVKENDNIRFSFRYGPNGKNGSEQSKIKHQEDAYNQTIPYSELKIHCFHISDNHMEYYTPELLEKEILTKYLKSSGNLPPANNEL